VNDTSDNAPRPSNERCNFFGEGRGQCLKPAYHILAVQKQQRYHTCEEDGRLLDVALTGLAAVREAERRRENAPETNVCLWQRDYPDNEFYFTTACGQEGVNKETSYEFCPYCSKKLTTNVPTAVKAGGAT
jgi:hypothetical protein